MTAASAPRRRMLAWEASRPNPGPLGRLALVWDEIAGRHPAAWLLETPALSDEASSSVSELSWAGFRAGFAAARIVAEGRSGAAYQALFDEIVDEADIELEDEA